MRLTYLYQPVTDLNAAVRFYSGVLGWAEAWREGEDTVAFVTLEGDPQVMLTTSDEPAGPTYRVDDLHQWIREHPTVPVLVEAYEIPGGPVAGFASPGGHAFYVFDQTLTATD